MSLSSFFWAVFGAILGVVLSQIVKLWETGKRRIIYSCHGNYLVLKNISRHTLFEKEDISANDPLRIILPFEVIGLINENLLKRKKRNPQGFSLSEEGILHFQYWENAVEIELSWNNTLNSLSDECTIKDCKGDKPIISGTLVDGQILASRIVQKEFDKKYAIAQHVVVFMFAAFFMSYIIRFNMMPKTLFYTVNFCSFILSFLTAGLYHHLRKTIEI